MHNKTCVTGGQTYQDK